MITAEKARKLSKKGYSKSAIKIIDELRTRIKREAKQGAVMAILSPPKFWLHMSESYNDYVLKNVFPYFKELGFNIYFDTLRENGRSWIAVTWNIIKE